MSAAPKNLNEAIIALKLTRTQRDAATAAIGRLRNALYNLLERPRAKESKREAERAFADTDWYVRMDYPIERPKSVPIAFPVDRTPVL